MGISKLNVCMGMGGGASLYYLSILIEIPVSDLTLICTTPSHNSNTSKYLLSQQFLVRELEEELQLVPLHKLDHEVNILRCHKHFARVRCKKTHAHQLINHAHPEREGYLAGQAECTGEE